MYFILPHEAKYTQPFSMSKINKAVFILPPEAKALLSYLAIRQTQLVELFK